MPKVSKTERRPPLTPEAKENQMSEEELEAIGAGRCLRVQLLLRL